MKGYEQLCENNLFPGGPDVPEKISAPDTVFKLYVASDEDLKALQPHLQPKHLPHRVNC
jgi:hypothetical protein